MSDSVKLGVFCTLTILFAACSGNKAVMAPPLEKASVAEGEVKVNTPVWGAPEWVNRGSDPLVRQQSRLIQGVGYAKSVGDLAQQKAIADDMARAEVARIFESFLAEYFRAFESQILPVAASGVLEVGYMNIGRLRQDSLSATRIVGSWRDPKSGLIWSIAELDIKHVKQSNSAIAGLSDDVKRSFDVSTDAIFDRFVKEKK